MKLTAIHSPFTTFCEGPDDLEKGYHLFYLFHRRNFLHLLPKEKNIEILVISSGVGYFQHSLKKENYTNVKGIDSDPAKVEYAQKKGFTSECANCFDFLGGKENRYDLIFAEQEINHLTRDEFIVLLELCWKSLKKDGLLIITAANSANPLIATEYLGNNIDHHTSFTENNLKQYFSMTQFKEIEIFPHDFYVLWNNPLNYIAKAVTGFIHFFLKMIFKMYGKSNKLFTKRIGVIAYK